MGDVILSSVSMLLFTTGRKRHVKEQALDPDKDFGDCTDVHVLRLLLRLSLWVVL